MTSAKTTAARLYHEIYLERQHQREAIAYEEATSHCDDCPRRNWDNYTPQSYEELEFGVHIAETCCYDDPEHWDAEWKADDEMTKLMGYLHLFAGDEEIAAAQAKVGQHDAQAH